MHTNKGRGGKKYVSGTTGGTDVTSCPAVDEKCCFMPPLSLLEAVMAFANTPLMMPSLFFPLFRC
jgi:hypothetical protein